MSAQTAILTTSGFRQTSPAKEEVARLVQRLRRKGATRYVTMSAADSTTGIFLVAESEDTLDEPWTRWIAIGSHARLHEAAREQQSVQNLLRFWDSVSEHTQRLSTPNIRLSTFAQTGPSYEVKAPTPQRPAPPIGEVAAELAAQVSDEEWADVPRDLARNVDHYLYGAPKSKEDA